MNTKSFNNTGTNKQAFLGKSAQDLVFLSSEQVLEIYQQRNIIIAVEVSSTLQYLYQNNNSALADIATALDLPHQLVAQRTAKLLKLQLIEKHPDPQDKRRTILELTDLGRQQAELLVQCMQDMALVYGQLYQEINCDLPQKLQDAIQALKHKPLTQRFEEMFTDGEDQ